MDAKKIFYTIKHTWLRREVEEKLKSFSSDYDYNIFNESGNTPLILAIKNRSFLFVKKLIECGADIDLPDPKGKPPLMHAYEDAQLSTITQLLISKKAKPSVYNNNILIRAVQAYDAKTVQLLIDTYPDIDLNLKIGGVIPILVECCGYDNEITQILCLACKDENQINVFREQLKQVVNPSLIESKENALKILNSMSLNNHLKNELVDNKQIKTMKI